MFYWCFDKIGVGSFIILTDNSRVPSVLCNENKPLSSVLQASEFVTDVTLSTFKADKAGADTLFGIFGPNRDIWH